MWSVGGGSGWGGGNPIPPFEVGPPVGAVDAQTAEALDELKAQNRAAHRRSERWLPRTIRHLFGRS